jgi:hypothetical protein
MLSVRSDWWLVRAGYTGRSGVRKVWADLRDEAAGTGFACDEVPERRQSRHAAHLVHALRVNSGGIVSSAIQTAIETLCPGPPTSSGPPWKRRGDRRRAALIALPE